MKITAKMKALESATGRVVANSLGDGNRFYALSDKRAILKEWDSVMTGRDGNVADIEDLIGELSGATYVALGCCLGSALLSCVLHYAAFFNVPYWPIACAVVAAAALLRHHFANDLVEKRLLIADATVTIVILVRTVFFRDYGVAEVVCALAEFLTPIIVTAPAIYEARKLMAAARCQCDELRAGGIPCPMNYCTERHDGPRKERLSMARKRSDSIRPLR